MPVVFALLLLLMRRSSLVTAQLTVLHKMCSNASNFMDGSQFESNLEGVLYRALKNEESDFLSYYNEGEEPDKVYSLFLCRRDVPITDCKKCINAAGQEILKECPFKEEAIIWYDQCMIRYSNRSFISIAEKQPAVCLPNPENVIEPDQFTEILDNMFANLVSVATSIPSNRMYATNETGVGNSTNLYGMVQCQPDLSRVLCSSCLNDIVSTVRACSAGKKGGRVLAPSCNVHYELHAAGGRSGE